MKNQLQFVKKVCFAFCSISGYSIIRYRADSSSSALFCRSDLDTDLGKLAVEDERAATMGREASDLAGVCSIQI